MRCDTRCGPKCIIMDNPHCVLMGRIRGPNENQTERTASTTKYTETRKDRVGLRRIRGRGRPGLRASCTYTRASNHVTLSIGYQVTRFIYNTDQWKTRRQQQEVWAEASSLHWTKFLQNMHNNSKLKSNNAYHTDFYVDTGTFEGQIRVGTLIVVIDRKVIGERSWEVATE